MNTTVWRERIAGLFGRTWLRYFLLAVAGFAVHLPSLEGQFLWDDGYLAQENPFIKSPLLFFETFRHYLFHDSFSAHYRPVQNLSYMFDYYFWNSDAAGFHLTNVLLHTASGLLLCRLLAQLFAELAEKWPGTIPRPTTSLAAWSIAMLWIVHPVHSAAVDYVSGRADSLAFALAAGAWLLVIRARGVTAWWAKLLLFLIAAVLAFLALCSREIACVWILIFLLHSLFFGRQSSRKALVITVACSLLLVAAYAGARHFAQGHAAPPSPGWAAPMRATLMLRALGDYTRLMICPVNLHMERTVFDVEEFASTNAWRESAAAEYLSMLGLITGAVFVCGSLRRGRGQPLRIFGVTWFFAAYLPVSNLFVLNATVAEHWLYLPSVGFLIFLFGLVIDCRLQLQRAATVLALVGCIALGARAWMRSGDWVDDATFFRRTVAAGGISSRTIVNLALAYSRRGQLEPAERALRRVVAVWPNYPLARNNLGNVLLKEGKTGEAEALFKTAAKSADEGGKDYPRTWIAYLNVATVRTNEKDVTGAIEVLERARDQYPDVWDLISRESELLRHTQNPARALVLVEGFRRKHPWHQSASLAAGRLQAELNDVPRAIEVLRHAALLDVHDTEALNLLAQIYFREGDLDRACATQRRAIARQPDQARQYLALASLLEKMGRSREADAELGKVTHLRDVARAQPAPVGSLAD